MVSTAHSPRGATKSRHAQMSNIAARRNRLAVGAECGPHRSERI